MSAKKKKEHAHGAAIDANAWMMSYADMATILLAMFIVLSTFSKDQSGISLYYGTGSFRAAVTSFGIPGLFEGSSQAVPLKATGTAHALQSSDRKETESGRESPQARHEAAPRNENPEQNRGRVIDIEEEQFQRFLDEMGRSFAVAKSPRVLGRSSIDIFDPIGKQPPYLNDRQRDLVAPLMGVLRRENYRLQVVVWAGIPRESAILRSAEEASAVVDELATGAGLDPAARRRLLAVGQSWRYSDVRRPVFSVIVTKTE
jgi:hypothetical protein